MVGPPTTTEEMYVLTIICFVSRPDLKEYRGGETHLVVGPPSMLATRHGMDTISVYKIRPTNAVECLIDMNWASGLIVRHNFKF